MAWFLDNYLGDGDRKDPKASPLLATDELVATTPCAHVLTARYDRCATRARPMRPVSRRSG